MPRSVGDQYGIVNTLIAMHSARGTLCALETFSKQHLFHPGFEVSVWRASLNIPKKLIVPYGTITFGSLTVILLIVAGKRGPLTSG